MATGVLVQLQPRAAVSAGPTRSPIDLETPMQIIRFAAFAAISLAVMLSRPAAGCTGILLRNSDGSVVHGRTVEFGIPIEMDFAFVPRGHAFTGSTPIGPGKTWTARHAAVGVVCFGVLGIMDGVNEQGLSVGAFYFPTFAEYVPTTAENRARSLSPVDFSNWVLTSFASIEEVRTAIEAGEAVVAPTLVPGWPAEPQPFHWIVYDRSGASLVIEPVGGRLVLHDNPIGVFTNAPTFDWHLTNLRNYLQVKPFDVPKVDLDGLSLQALGLGGSMLGLPADFSSPSRFVRATYFCATAFPAPSPSEGVMSGFHILNQFDIPAGAVRMRDGDRVESDRTLMTVMRDPVNLRIYYRTETDQTLRMVELRHFDPTGPLQRLPTAGSQQVIDMSERFATWAP